jgi:hypothetical protein
MQKRWFALSAMLLLTVLACNQTLPQPIATQVPEVPNTTAPEAPQQPTTTAPVGGVVVAKNTKILSTSALQQITSFSSKTGQIHFQRQSGKQLATLAEDGALNNPEALQAGDVINAGITEQTPYGLLQKVVDVQNVGDEIVVDTTPVSIEQVVEEGDVEDIEAPFVVDQTVLAQMQDNNVTRASATPRTVTVAGWQYQTSFPRTDLSNGAGLLFASGNLNWNARIKLGLGFRWFRLKTFKALVELDAAESFKLEGPGNAQQFDHTVVLARFPGQPIQADIPILDIGRLVTIKFKLVLTPYIEIRMNASGKISSQVTMSYTRQDNYQAGVEWTDANSWQPILQHRVLANRLVLSPSTAKFKFGIGPALGVVFYGKLEVKIWIIKFTVGLANANISVVALGFIEIDSDTSRTPRWILSAGLEVISNLQGSIVGFHFNQSLPLANIKRVLASGNGFNSNIDGTSTLETNVVLADETGVQLAWGPVAGVNGYQVERSQDGASFDAPISMQSTSYVDPNVVAGQSYVYRVTTTLGSGDELSDTVVVSIPNPDTGGGGCGLAPPTQLRAIATSRPVDPC